MEYYPIFLDIKDKPCVVIGGGKVAERKVLSLLDAGAKVCVISPDVTPAIKRLACQKKIKIISRAYKQGDVKGLFLVYSATDNRTVSLMVFKEAQKNGILLNVVDVPELCNFIVPSVVERGALLIAISTSGKSPAMAKKIRERLEKEFGTEYGVFLDIMGKIREKVLTGSKEPDKNKKIFEELVNSALLDLIRQKNKKEIDSLLKRLLGSSFTLSKMKVKL
ncbi:MAG: bifunctional precorrin-2 dehydrogenase/sirohydrochlorin ferrochelatase [Deltaproteobacteria bacterium]|nr:bifunctional precorrin-2 dehydrogenase/sirohydrochlorin ferrochelatase [Deltaproteobacteria bacterium]